MNAPSLFDAVPEPAAGPAGLSTADGPLRLRAATWTPPRTSPVVVPARHRRTLLAVDGNSLVHRAYHAYREDALYGVMALLAGIADKVPFDAVVVGFDDTGICWRRRRWPGYKAQRPPKPPALSALLQRVPQVLARLGIAVITSPGHEADDVLGSAAAGATASGWCSVLATSDRDAYGLVDDTTTVLRLRSGLDNAVAVTPRVVRATVGVTASQYVAFAALRGDPSDNLPGVRGIGASRARALLAAFPTVDAAAADEIGCLSVLGREVGRVLLDDLAAAESVFRRNVDLMTIRRDVACDLRACSDRLHSDAVERTCVAEGLAPVAGRMAAAFGARPAPAPPPPGPPD